jgi:hypothetical protein
MLSYIYKVHTKDYIKTSIYKELLRYKIIQKLIKIFIINITKINNKYNILNKNNFKRYINRKLYDYVQTWCWKQYNNTSLQDIVIPYVSDNKYNFDEFIENINDSLNTKFDIIIFNKLIYNVKKYLKNAYNKFSNISNIDIFLEKEIIEGDIILKCNYEDRDYNLKIYKNLYDRLYQKYKNNNDNMDNIDKYIYCLYFRYAYMDANNQQLAIHPNIKKLLRSININFELFGSGINTFSDNYCSIYYDIEKFFGSKGNFLDIEIIQGIYWCNPPYINSLMKNCAIKVIDIINRKKEVGFIITIPIWDKETKKLKFEKILKDNNSNILQNKYIDYPIYYLLKPYIKYELIIPKFKIPYLNLRYNKFIYAVDTYMLFIYNKLDNIYINNVVELLDNIYYNSDNIIK